MTTYFVYTHLVKKQHGKAAELRPPEDDWEFMEILDTKSYGSATKETLHITVLYRRCD